MEIEEILKEDEKVPFIASQDEKLDRQAFKRACLMSERSSVLVELGDEKQINKAMDKMNHFDYRVISLINKWSNSAHPEREIDLVSINGKPGAEVMKENGYSFMDCMMLAQTAIEKNKPCVEFDMAVSGDQKRHDQKMNLSDPSLKNIPPSHMPKLLDRILKVATLGFYQNREERMNRRKEMEMIRFAAVERVRLSRLAKEDKSARAEEARQKMAQNRERAEQGEQRRREFDLYQYDERHSRDRLQKMEKTRNEASQKLVKLGERHEKLKEQAAESRRKLEGIRGAKESAEKWLKENPDWKTSPAKTQTASRMLERVSEYNKARQDYEKIGMSLAKLSQSSQKLMKALGEAEARHPRMTELYQKQAQHKLTEEERKELSELEKPGAVMGGTQTARPGRAQASAPQMQNAATAVRQAPEAGGKPGPQARQAPEAGGKPGPQAKQAPETGKPGPQARQAPEAGGKPGPQAKQAPETGKPGPQARQGQNRQRPESGKQRQVMEKKAPARQK